MREPSQASSEARGRAGDGPGGGWQTDSRTDLVESAWRVAQPVLDVWRAVPPEDFPNYAAGSWGPKAAFDLLAQDGRRWLHSKDGVPEPIIACPL